MRLEHTRARPQSSLPQVFLLLSLITLLLGGCQSLRTGGAPDLPGGKGVDASGRKLSPVQEKLVEGAYFIRGKNRIQVNGRSFNNDCTGAVLAVYWYAGMDLSSPLRGYQGNGVSRLYHFLEDEKLLEETKTPHAGDIIFWDNTYDRNGDKKPNDYLTHTGVVVDVEEDGTIHYVHHNYRKGVVFAKMNLFRPGVYTENVNGAVRIVNSPMRMRGSPDYDKWLASQLTRSFGRAWKAF